MNKFNNSISVNVNVGKSSYRFNGLAFSKRANICDRSTLFSEEVIKQVCFKYKSFTNSLFTRRDGMILMESLKH